MRAGSTAVSATVLGLAVRFAKAGAPVGLAALEDPIPAVAARGGAVWQASSFDRTVFCWRPMTTAIRGCDGMRTGSMCCSRMQARAASTDLYDLVTGCLRHVYNGCGSIWMARRPARRYERGRVLQRHECAVPPSARRRQGLLRRRHDLLCAVSLSGRVPDCHDVVPPESERGTSNGRRTGATTRFTAHFVRFGRRWVATWTGAEDYGRVLNQWTHPWDRSEADERRSPQSRDRWPVPRDRRRRRGRQLRRGASRGWGWIRTA
jgi:hypothetical protein